MVLVDVNILTYAHREELPEHSAYKRWIEDTVRGEQAYGMSDLVFSGFLRITTNPRVFKTPSTLESALLFVDALRSPAHCVHVSPGPRHWEIFSQLLRKTRSKGGLVTDAYLAALAIETGSEWITADRDFARFPGLKWRHPLD